VTSTNCAIRQVTSRRAAPREPFRAPLCMHLEVILLLQLTRGELNWEMVGLKSVLGWLSPSAVIASCYTLAPFQSTRNANDRLSKR